MFKEIEKELLSIISEESIERIAHRPTPDIAKTMDLIYNIKFDDIERVYNESMSRYNKLIVIHNSEDGNHSDIKQTLIPINGTLYHITMIPSKLLNKDENNANILTNSIINYIIIRIALVRDHYSGLIQSTSNSTLDQIMLQAIPVITCSIMRKIYSGPTLPKLIYSKLCDNMEIYKVISSEEGINSILNLFDDGLGVDELIDGGFILTIHPDDKKYPGIWGIREESNIEIVEADKTEE